MSTPLSFNVRSYYLLTKPGIIIGNLIVAAAGFALASNGHFNVLLFLATLLGLGLIIASACVFNNFIDRKHDQKMERTKNRALASGRISAFNAIAFANCLLLMGCFILATQVNLLSLFISLFGFVMYVLVYSFSKYLTTHGTLIGSISGAVPPVIGYTAASNTLDLGALIFFAMIVLWQMPHFFAIAIRRLEDYKAASIPVLPLKRGLKNTKIQMLLYIVAFTVSCTFLTVQGYTKESYLVISVLMGFMWLLLGFKGFKAGDDILWAKRMFLFSLIIIMVLSIAIPFNVVQR